MKNINLLLFLFLSFYVGLFTSCEKYDFSDPDKAVQTVSVTSTNSSEAIGFGNVISNGGNALVERGICWSTHKNPTFGNISKRDSKNTLGNFSINISGLNGSTTYYVRAYAKTSTSIAYGNQLVFSTMPKGVPSVFTKIDSTIYLNYKNVSGTIISNGGDAIISRGFCWNILPNPTIANRNISLGLNTSTSFSSTISALTQNTKYYIKAWAKNNIGISYGNEVSFTTGQPQLAYLYISSPTNITKSTANASSFISQDGGASITTRGVCWSLTTNPTIYNNITSDGTGLGSFTSNITGLSSGKTYFIRAYASNSVGTSYSNELSFSTLPSTLPVFGNQVINSVSYTGASISNYITDDGGSSVTSKGVCWSPITSSPTILNSKTIDGTGLGPFTSSISGLTGGSVYYVRGYATNSVGTTYSNTLSINTLNYSLATISLKSVSFINKASSTCQSSIISDGGSSITSRGVCWSTNPNPTINNPKTNDGIGIGTFSSSITGLTSGLTYYIRTYAINSAGIAYSNQVVYPN